MSKHGETSTAQIPYPPVFRDWQDRKQRVATVNSMAGVGVEMLIRQGIEGVQGALWKRVELTEADACLLAASLLERAGESKLSKRVLARAAALNTDGGTP